MTIEECIKGLQAIRTVHNGNYAKHIDMAVESMRELEKYEQIFVKIGEILGENGYSMDDIEAFSKYGKEVQNWGRGEADDQR